jgi:hypothetical protein
VTSAARDIRYGRRGGGWVDHRPSQRLAELRVIQANAKAAGRSPAPVDRARLFHPDTIAAARAHHRDCRGPHRTGEPCPAQPGPVELAEIRAGRARTAAARRAAGVPLDALDVEALGRSPR